MTLPSKQLVVFGADKDVLAVLQTLLLKRPADLKIRPLRADEITFHRDVLHDSSPVSRVTEMLRGYQRSHQHGLVIRDLAGSGYESVGATRLEAELAEALAANGWAGDRLKVIVIVPEIEQWLRFESRQLSELIRINCRASRQWNEWTYRGHLQSLVSKHGGTAAGKPVRPKEVFQDLLRVYGIPQSSALYAQLAERESWHGCTVPSFCELLATLQRWFPPPSWRKA